MIKMTKVTRESLIKRVFSDPKNYPYGFSRSGDFSINESKALTQYGCLVSALVDGELQPENDEDRGFIEAAFNHKEPETAAERAWVKYQKRINRPKLGSIYGHQKAEISDDDETITDDTEIEIDVEE